MAMQQILIGYILAAGGGGGSEPTPNYSTLFDGDGDYLDSPNNGDFIGTSNFTVEFWVRFASTAATLETISETRSSTGASDGFLLGRFHGASHDNQLELYTNGNYSGVASGALSNNTWYYIAVVRNAGTTKMYVDGQDTGTSYADSNNYNNDDIRIGANISTQYFMDGNIADYRVTKSALYTSNFSVPTEQLTGIQYTSLLCCQDDTNPGSATVGSNFTEVGDVVAAASAATTSGGGNQIYVDDVFSTYLQDATSSAPLNVDNGIDLAGEGGLVWFKKRNGSGTFGQHVLFDSERNANNGLLLPSTGGESILNGPPYSNSFDSDGFTWGSENNFHPTGAEYVSWTFRKAPGFFDVVTYIGDSSLSQVINHSLGSVPGCIMIKRTDATSDWYVYHVGHEFAPSEGLALNLPTGTSSTYRALAAVPTSTTFTSYNNTNTDGANYVAYIFAHDEPVFGTDEDESIIKCGTFEGNVGTVVNLGFEPQWILVKRVDGARNWFIYDTMRGLPGSDNANTLSLSPNLSGTDTENDARSIHITSTGFKVSTTTGLNPDTHVYMAIRRPHKPPVYGTDVFNAVRPSSSGTLTAQTGFVTDWSIIKSPDAGGVAYSGQRLTGGNNLTPESVAREASVGFSFDFMDKVTIAGTGDYSTWISWNFRRTPGVLDIVTYDGNSSSAAFSHNLGVKPELVIFKSRSHTQDWIVKFQDRNNYLYLEPQKQVIVANYFEDEDTETTFYGATANAMSSMNGFTYIAYLFASKAGVSKIGTYTGTSNTGAILVDLGFRPRFLMVKSLNQDNRDWIVFDSIRNFRAGSTSAIGRALNNNNTEAVQNETDSVRINSAGTGFVVVGSSASTNVNELNEEYLYLAIA